MKKKFDVSRISVIIYWLMFIVLLGFFFTNDFGLVDIHKTAIITAVGIDVEEEEVVVTAEVVVPQPSQSGENIKYAQVQGSGLTIADALNEINAKTGFYPKLQFCKLILIGESCRERPLFQVLGCFYRKNYSELTALVAMCQGKASDMLSLQSPVTDMTSEAIRKVLSEEIEKSANAASVSLKDIALTEYSQSGACYMPYVEANEQGTSESGGNGDNVGGEGGNSGESGGGSGSSGGGGGESGGSGGSEGATGQSSGGSSGSSEEQKPMEFTARRAAIFSGGEFKGILNEQQSFALSVLENEIRLAVLPCDADGIHYTIGLKNVDAGLSLDVENGVPVLTVSFEATAQVNGAKVPVDPKKTILDDVVSAKVLSGAKEELINRFDGLINVLKEADCDVLGVKNLLHKYNYKYFEAFRKDVLDRMQVKYDIDVKSVN